MKNKHAAASAYIRKLLSERGLDPENFDEKFSTVKIADIYVQEEIT